MKQINFSVPYPIGTYLTKNVNGDEHLDQVNKYVINKDGIFAILMLDVETTPRLSTPISIDNLLQNWKENTKLLSNDIRNRLHMGMQFEDKPIIENGPIKSLNKKC